MPSWADVGYLSAIPFAVAALVAHPATGGGGTRKARSLFDALLVATALMFLSWTLCSVRCGAAPTSAPGPAS